MGRRGGVAIYSKHYPEPLVSPARLCERGVVLMAPTATWLTPNITKYLLHVYALPKVLNGGVGRHCLQDRKRTGQIWWPKKNLGWSLNAHSQKIFTILWGVILFTVIIYSNNLYNPLRSNTLTFDNAITPRPSMWQTLWHCHTQRKKLI